MQYRPITIRNARIAYLLVNEVAEKKRWTDATTFDPWWWGLYIFTQ